LTPHARSAEVVVYLFHNNRPDPEASRDATSSDVPLRFRSDGTVPPVTRYTRWQYKTDSDLDSCIILERPV